MKDYTGPNTLLSAFRIIRQAIKSASLSAGDGLTKTGDTLSVTTPVRGIVTQAEFDALTEEQRNKGLYVIPGGGTGGEGGESAGEVYSTEETRIGTWIDGKPIYRKVFIGTAGTNLTAVSVPLSALYVDHLIDVHAIIEDSNGNITFITSYSDEYTTVPSLFTSKTSITINAVKSILGGNRYYIIVEYTKTTDEGGTA